MSNICLTNLEDPTKALKKLKNIRTHFKGINFEIGRALYFSNSLKQAKDYFKKSIIQGYKKSQSYHYLGSSDLKLGKFKAAKKSFQTLLAKTKPSTWVLQDTYYQIGNIHFEIAKRELRTEDMGSLLKDHVLSYLNKSLQIAPKSKVAKKVRRKIYLIKTKYEIN